MAYHNHFVLNSLGGNPKSAMPFSLALHVLSAWLRDQVAGQDFHLLMIEHLRTARTKSDTAEIAWAAYFPSGPGRWAKNRYPEP
jgi:hypothetical protein